MPIFKSFIQSALKKENTRPFKVPENITMMVVDSKTGKKVSFASKKTLIESFKSDKVLEKTNISKKINNRFDIFDHISSIFGLFISSKQCLR